jgi:hypothetical protein
MPAKRNGRYAHLATPGTDATGLVANLDAEGIGDAVKAVAGAGDCILIAATKGGVSLRVQLMSGDERETVYLNSTEEANNFFSGLTSHITKYLT